MKVGHGDKLSLPCRIYRSNYLPFIGGRPIWNKRTSLEMRGSGPGLKCTILLNHHWFLQPVTFATIEKDISPQLDVPVLKPQEEEIKSIVEKAQRVLKLTRAVHPNWDFFENALRYLGKAALAKPDLEQLLWNISVLDCLLGDKAEVTQSIKRRLSNIIGTTDEEKKRVKRWFEELYEFRSDLVHGNSFKKKAQYHHLAKARDLARRAMGWFVDYLLCLDTDLRRRGISYDKYPVRKELLYVLDVERSSLNRLNQFIGRLPATFPKFER